MLLPKVMFYRCFSEISLFPVLFWPLTSYLLTDLLSSFPCVIPTPTLPHMLHLCLPASSLSVFSLYLHFLWFQIFFAFV